MSDENKEPGSDASPKLAPPPEKAVPAASPDPAPMGPESQRQRWVKYGSNVGLSIIVVVVLAGLIIWLSQARNLEIRKWQFSFRRSIDVTSDSSQSLKPQTVSVISNLQTPVKLVCLYPKLKPEKAATEQDFQTPVVDLLEKYRDKGRNIDVEVIDPVNEPVKLDHWIGELKEKYGGNTKAYHDLLATDLPKTLEDLNKQASDEVTTMKKLVQQGAFQQMDEDQVAPFQGAYSTVAQFPKVFAEISKGTHDELDKQLPDYKLFTDSLKESLSQFSANCDALHTIFEKAKDDKKLPEPVRKYAADSFSHYEQMRKLADDLAGKINKLGELKLDEVREVLAGVEKGGDTPPPPIAVMGPSGIKLIQFNDVWKSGENIQMLGANTGPPKLRFAGEQQTTSAIIALSETKKPKVCFLRAGGQSLLMPTNFMQDPRLLMAEAADRLRGYNFDVSEKDVTHDPSRPQQDQMPTAPEPSWEDIKDATWVIVDQPMESQQFGPVPPSPLLAEKLKEHLDQGGSAVCLVGVHGDSLATVLKDWGISIDPEKIIIHQRIDAPEAEGDDFIEQARRRPPIFILNDYGDSPVTTPLQALDSVLLPLCPVKTANDKPADTTVTAILPIPEDPKIWATSKIEAIDRPDAQPTFDSATDTPPPLFAGAIAEKKGKGRVVVIGCANFIRTEFLTLPDPKLAKQKVVVARFPGNGELFTNSVFWCSHEDRMIALSPAALDTARIQKINPGLLNFLRYGLVLIVLPLLAVASGLVVYQSRRA